MAQKSVKIHKIYMGENRLHAQEVVIVVGIYSQGHYFKLHVRSL